MNHSQSPLPRRRLHLRIGLWLLSGVMILSIVLMVGYLSMTGRVIRLPEWLTQRVEARADAAMAAVGVEIGAIDVIFSRSGVPQVFLRYVNVTDAEGRQVARLPIVQAVLAARPLLRGQIAVRRVALKDTELALHRAVDGSFDLALGGAVAPVSADSLAQVLDQIDRSFLQPPFASVESVTVESLTLSYEDSRAGRGWRVSDGLMTLDQSADAIKAQVFFSLTNDQGVPSEVAIGLETLKGSPEAHVNASFSAVPSADIAAQSPALAFLTVIDAPVSGAIRAGVQADGQFAPMTATLDIGAGALRPLEQAAPIRFESGKSRFAYDPAAQKITFSQLSVDTSALRLRAQGHAYLRDTVNGWPTSLITQIRVDEMLLSPDGVFADPVALTGGAIDLKLTLDPFTAQLGQAVMLDQDGAAYRSSGLVRAGQDGWQVSLDMSVDQLTDNRLVAMWPVDVVPNTRRWVADHLRGGTLFDVQAALRLATGQPGRLLLTHEFRDTSLKFLPALPPVEQAHGYVTMTEKDFTLVLDAGRIDAPGGGAVDVAGTVFKVPDISEHAPHAEIELHVDSPIPALLSVLNQPPLSLLGKAGHDVDIAEGRAALVARLGLQLKQDLQPADVAYSVTGTLETVRSDRVVPGRVLGADKLRLYADPGQISISGAARLDDLPVQGVWSQKIGPDSDGTSRVEAVVELSQRFADMFGIGLPAGSIQGVGSGEIQLDLTPQAPVRFRLTSDLNRLGLGLPALGWSKARNERGSLLVEGQLGNPASITRLDLNAGGLNAQGGTISLSDAGALRQARFTRVRLGGWLDAPVVLTGQGRAGASPAIALPGGRMDLRRSPFATPGAGGGGTTIDIGLEQILVSDSIVLTQTRGRLSTRGGLNGSLTAMVRGGAPAQITLVPHPNGTSIRVQSADAGGVMRGAGVFSKSNGGAMDLVLTPTADKGEYDGAITIDRVRVKDAPALAELLSAVSVVGLLEMLDGEGLIFNDVKGRFHLSPRGVELSQGSAVGPSLGISMAGIMDFRTGQVDMRGVFSPVYLLNGIGSVLTRRGEGVFGFNYHLYGPAKNPKVGVNPLSVLTPGMFRELFRRPPPELEE